MTADLSAFLLARAAEDEAVALALVDELPGGAGLDWRAQDRRLYIGGSLSLFDSKPVMIAHIARHEPARVLAHCAAIRAVVEVVRRQVEEDDPYIPLPGEVLRALATIWRDHPDYRPEEWA